jgi:cell division protein FtsB
VTTQRRSPSGQGPSRRPGSSRVRHTGPVRNTGNVRGAGGGAARTGAAKNGENGASTGNGASRGVSRNTVSKNTNRPTASRRTGKAARGATKRTVAPRPRALTGRAMVLISVFVALALAYTYPLRVYLAQESQIAQLKADQAAETKQIQDKNEQLLKWQDPAYIEAQARAKYFYVRPGETPLRVIDDPAGAAKDAGTKAPAAPTGSWYDTLWGSVRSADAESSN